MPARSSLEKAEEPTKFMLVGLSGVAVNYIILWLLYTLMHVNEQISVGGAIFVSMNTNYFLNRKWTFRSSGSMLPEYIRYMLSNLVGGLIQYGTALVVHYELVQWGYPTLTLIFTIDSLYFANGLGIGLGFVANYLFSKYFVFRKPPPSE